MEIVNVKKCLSIPLLILMVTTSVQAQINIAVLNFTARGVGETETQVVSDRIRIAVQQSAAFRVVEREYMNRILTEQKFQQSGCVESACMVEVGKILAVQQIVGGSLSKIGNQYIIEAKIIDVQSGLIITNVAKDFSGEFETLLSRTVPEVAAQLLKAPQKIPAPKSNIAVFEFAARNITQVEAAIISDRIRVELKNTETFNVLEREMMKRILDEQAFQQSGCTESECLVEVGRLLAVDKMVGGSISKVGSLFVIEARIVDTETGIIEHNVVEDFSGPIELLLINVTKKIAQRLAGQTVSTEPYVPIFTGVSDLTIESTPTNGQIFLDNVPLNMNTPYTLRNAPSGKHKIRIEQGELSAEKEVTIIAGQIQNIMLKLKERKYSLIVTSQPSGAGVYSNGLFVNWTPCTVSLIKKLTPYYFEIRKDGYCPIEYFVTDTMLTVGRLELFLEQRGAISLNSTPDSARVFINDYYSGITPFKSKSYKLGTYRILVKKDYYEPQELEINLTPESPAYLNRVTLNPYYSHFTITRLPLSAKLEVDYQDYGDRNEFDIVQGIEHNLRVSKDGYVPYRETIFVDTSKIYERAIKLYPKSRSTAVILSMLLPGAGQIYFGDGVKGRTFVGATYLLYRAITSCNAKFDQTWQTYENDRRNYLLAVTLPEIESAKKKMNASYEEAVSNKRLTQLSAGLAAVFWIYNVFDIYRSFIPVLKESRSLGISAGHNQIEFSLWF